MAIFDLDKDELLRLSDIQLEELVARLAEAEVATHAHSPAWVNWSGSINAPDNGIDIHVEIPVETLNTGFLERPDTILQAKKHSMPRSKITNEMAANGELSATISNQALKGGSYIIVSLGDDCSPPMKRARLDAMREATLGDPNSNNIHLDFYDRSRLCLWLRRHSSVMLWVKGKLGQGYSGWQPYGAWSNPPQGTDDTLISAPGVTVTLPSGDGQKLGIEDAIEPMRNLIRSTTKAIRITGLSGVGKTRIVQALFDETVGTDALDRTIAVYVDTGADPDPSATAMFDRLISEGRRAVMILDNCPAELHSSLASKASASSGQVSLITVEYDIRDDKPQTTEVINIEAVGPEVAEQLVIRRFPRIGQNNARRIAKFSDGNARVSLAIAEWVEEGESLALLSDSQLFSRLFEQRNQPDDNLQEQAEILSLVYSFSVSTPEAGQSELEVLGSILGYSQNQLYRSVSKLMGRHVVQKRAHWRAILPHAIANKLAALALDSIPVNQLKDIFEAPGRRRLLMSFAHRLGLMHEHPIAQEIAKSWIRSEGLLGQLLELDDSTVQMLDYIAPVAPDALLDKVEAELVASNFEGLEPRYNPVRKSILSLLQSIAYEPNTFDRSLRLMIGLADKEDESNNYDPVRAKITGFFQAYLSGTHASLEQRLAIMNECFLSEKSERRSLAFEMLSTALDGPRWTSFGINDFGARPRDYGFHPNNEELVEWRSSFIDVAVRLGNCGDPELEVPARLTLANNFRGLWHQGSIREKVIDASMKLHAYYPWGEGWKAVRSTIYFDYTDPENVHANERLPEDLASLEKVLEPDDLIPTILAYVLSEGSDYWALDEEFSHKDKNSYSKAEKNIKTKVQQLGKDFASSDHELYELGQNLFICGWMPYRATFGRGLANGADDHRVYWNHLLEQLEHQPGSNHDLAVFGGFIEEVGIINPALVQDLLDQCALHTKLRQILVGLHHWGEFTETDLDRCMAVLDDPDILPAMYGPILWRKEYSDLPVDRILDLARQLLNKPNGDDVVLDALSMILHCKEETEDTLGSDLRLIGLRAATQRINRDNSDFHGSIDYDMAKVVSAALRFDGNKAIKLEWLDAIITYIVECYGYVHEFEIAIQGTIALMPEEFLNRMFEGTAVQQRALQVYLSDGDGRLPPLSQVDVDVLIDWCQTRSEANVWAIIAAGIYLWAKEGDQGEVMIAESAIKLLEASSEPKMVLDTFAERVAPSSWTGSRANIMQVRTDALCGLITDVNTENSELLKPVSEKLHGWIKREREREQREDEKLEQRFE